MLVEKIWQIGKKQMVKSAWPNSSTMYYMDEELGHRQ